MTGCRCRGDEQQRDNGSFWCERHQCWKTQHRLGLCRDHAGYFDLWEQGCGPGQSGGESGHAARKDRAKPPPGVGTELRKLLGCCGFRHVKQLNEWGPDGCLERLDEIVAMLLEQSCKSKGLLSDHAARRLVKLAVEQSRATTCVTSGDSTDAKQIR